ncbi:hypothetical protein HanPI659440_Chr03g0125441 [Helianthus annuus]|nr:hypothetical protein HanPI659440_Chr03g0125441 [Helianthus annuus]
MHLGRVFFPNTTFTYIRILYIFLLTLSSFTQFQIFTDPKSELFICFSFLCNLIPYPPTASSQSSQTLFLFDQSMEDNDGGV